jgi:hypothetical protein
MLSLDECEAYLKNLALKAMNIKLNAKSASAPAELNDAAIEKIMNNMDNFVESIHRLELELIQFRLDQSQEVLSQFQVHSVKIELKLSALTGEYRLACGQRRTRDDLLESSLQIFEVQKQIASYQKDSTTMTAERLITIEDILKHFRDEVDLSLRYNKSSLEGLIMGRGNGDINAWGNNYADTNEPIISEVTDDDDDSDFNKLKAKLNM